MELSIVSSHYNEDLCWLERSPYPVYVVSKNQDALLDETKFFKVHKIINRGSEFGSYFWFICNYWDSMPDKVAFIHGHEESRHQSLPMFEAINLFKHSSFHGLNGPKQMAYHYFLENQPHPWFENPGDGWKYFKLDSIGPMPSQLVFQNGTQTIISKDLIKSNPISFYQHILEKLFSARSKEESWYMGVFLETVWHLIFKQDPIDSELWDKEIDSFLVSNKISLAIFGKRHLWHARSGCTISFEEIGDRNNWLKGCKNILFHGIKM